MDKKDGLTKGQRLLATFCEVFSHFNPAGLPSDDGYEIESLSILARFNEVHVGALAGEARDEVARAAVVAGLDAWHGKGRFRDGIINMITIKLIDVYNREPASNT